MCGMCFVFCVGHNAVASSLESITEDVDVLYICGTLFDGDYSNIASCWSRYIFQAHMKYCKYRI